MPAGTPASAPPLALAGEGRLRPPTAGGALSRTGVSTEPPVLIAPQRCGVERDNAGGRGRCWGVGTDEVAGRGSLERRRRVRE